MPTQPRVRTRIAPSPTGEDLHIGNVYTALINYAWAKKHKGDFIVRIEDTDQKRIVEGSEERILKSLEWFGLKSDEKVIHQSERRDIYKKYAEELVEKGHAYYCDCTAERLEKVRKDMQKKGKPPKYDGKCRRGKRQEVRGESSVIRMKVPNKGSTIFTDIIRGEIEIDNSVLDDQVILKSDGYPTYHLAVVVDDHLMKISHVIRAEEWISSTPKHVLLYQFFGWKLPHFAHVPILRNPNQSKLSKRKNPVWASWYRDEGYLPEAILNYLSTLGWAHPEGKDVFSLTEFIKHLELQNIQTSGPVFDIQKLEWFNGEYIRKLKVENLKLKVDDYLIRHSGLDPESIKSKSSILEKSIPLIQTRIKKLSEYWPLCSFFFVPPDKFERTIEKKWLKKTIETAQAIKNWNHESMYRQFGADSVHFDVSKSKYFMNIRIAIAGKKVGPPLFESMEVLRKKECLERLKAAL